MMSRTAPLVSRCVMLLAIVVLLDLSAGAAAPVSGYKIVATYPHSTRSYTEGFFYRDGLFYEGTGIEGRSAVMAIEPATGKAVQMRDLPERISAKASSTGVRTSTNGPGSRTSALCTTASACGLSGSSPTPARAGA